MSKYNDTNVNRMYTRAHTITFNFPHESTQLPPSVHFYEHNVIEDALGNEHALPETIGQADLEVPMETMRTSFGLRDLLTEEPIDGASATYGEVATLLYSLYFHVAELRDQRLAALQAAAGEEPTEPLESGMDMPLVPAEPVEGP